MITPPNNWDAIYGAEGSVVEFRAVVNLVAGIQAIFTDSEIGAGGFTFEKRLFDNWSIGNAMSAHLSFEAINAATEIPLLIEGQRCVFECRAVNGDSATEWVQLGIFYVDSVNVNGGSASISAFDQMSRLEQETPVFTEDITLGEYAQLLEATSGISLLVGSPLLSATYVKAGEQTSQHDLPPTTVEPLSNLVLPASMSGTNARTIVASAAALAGGNAIIDSNEVLQFVAIDATSFNYDPGTIPVYYSDERRYLNAIRFSQIFIAGKTEMASGLGFGIPANVADKLLVDDGYSMYKWNTAELIYNAVFSNTKKMVEGYAIAIENVEISPLIELRDQVSYNDSNGNPRMFRINGFRLDCAGWSVGELSTQIHASDIELKMISSYSYLMGWRDPVWGDIPISDGGSIAPFSKVKTTIESEKSFVSEATAFNPSNRYSTTRQCKAVRLGELRCILRISLCYIGGSAVHDVEIPCYVLPCDYTAFNTEQPQWSGKGNNTIAVRFVCDDSQPGIKVTDISMSSPLYATIVSDGEQNYQELGWAYRS